MGSIQLFNQTDASLPVTDQRISQLVHLLEDGEDCSYRFVEIVIVSEERIIEINQQYLDRSYLTDIISFRYDENDNQKDIEGTLFCCWSRIKEQATEYDAHPQQELQRVIIHGLLHLLGYEDRTDEQNKRMREREDHYLSKIASL